MEDFEFYYDVTKLETQIIAQRNNYFLLCNSMMMTATVLLFQKNSYINPFIMIISGIILSIFWIYINYQTRTIEVNAFNVLIKIDHRVKRMIESRKKINSFEKETSPLSMRLQRRLSLSCYGLFSVLVII